MSPEDLDGERDLLLLSLEDLEREHAAGDISDEDYEELRDLYTARAASVLRELTRLEGEGPRAGAPGDGHRRRRENTCDEAGEAGSHRRRWTRLVKPRRGIRWSVVIVGSIVLLVGFGLFMVVSSTAGRLPGETATGSVRLSPQQQLQRTLVQAETLESEGKAAEALELYQQVLAQDPGQDQALSESGWLEYEAGVEAKSAKLLSEGQDEEVKAENSDPGAYAPHLYLGSMFLVEARYQDAVGEYSSFLADTPPLSVVKSAAPFVDRAFAGAHLPAPTLPAGS